MLDFSFGLLHLDVAWYQSAENVPSAERLHWPNGNDSQVPTASSNLRPVKEEHAHLIENKQGAFVWSDPLSDNAGSNPGQTIMIGTSSVGSIHHTNNAISNSGSIDSQQFDKALQERTSERAQPPGEQYRAPNQIYLQHSFHTNQANTVQADLDRESYNAMLAHRNDTTKAGQSRPHTSLQPPQSHTNQMADVKAAAVPTYRVNQMEPLARPNLGGSQSVKSATGQAPAPTFARPSAQSQSSYQNYNHGSTQAQSQSTQNHPLLPYNNRAPQLHGLSKSGASTPAVIT